MANGVPEHEVWAAADAVLARGERPTVERVRTELGRGSPARVGQLLEQWWEHLAQRLKGHALLPELPGEVAQAFAEAWRLALAHADTTAQVALREEHNRLFAEQTSLTQERKLWEIALAEAQADLAEGANKLTQGELQLAERQGLVDRLTTEVTDARQQRDHLQIHVGRREAELDALRADHAAAQAHIRSVEDRAHQQVDQARLEIKALRQQQERTQREHEKQVAKLMAQCDALRAAARSAEQAAAHQAGQVAALEAAVSRWRRAQATSPNRATGKVSAAKTNRPRRPKNKDSQ
ncbi:DNA-binding protein [Dyella sp. GSA-30]|uniref:DNA-binding protein n=1 Tax=Dyella sp. GSA-30 TaxID=2994496 RepID=UPI0024909221|nr:DNA-binding protein [Dyella sp. GSA-30]BDU21591.1 hypothetical protein DYGSA30_30480 [Dyella sp. GSA-30]